MGREFGFRPPFETENAIELGGDRIVAFDWRTKLAQLEGAYAETTIRGYAYDFAAFERKRPLAPIAGVVDERADL
jgi:hypothetical protein